MPAEGLCGDRTPVNPVGEAGNHHVHLKRRKGAVSSHIQTRGAEPDRPGWEWVAQKQSKEGLGSDRIVRGLRVR